MKSLLLFIIIILFCFISCQKKAIPVITERKEKTWTKTTRDSILATITPDTLEGKSVFIARCARCHDLPLPDQYTASEWEGILSTMMTRARLNNEQKIHIAAYLKTHAAK